MGGILRVLVFLTLLVILVNAATFSFSWNSKPTPTSLLWSWYWYKVKYAKCYLNTTADSFRKKIFARNMVKTKRHNELYAIGKVHHKTGVNQFTDMLDEEVAQITRSYVPMQLTGSRWRKNFSDTLFVGSSHRQLPKEVDWRKHGIVSEVKNQGECSACWAFSAAGALEGLFARKNKSGESISVQNLIDCSSPYGNRGCKGGNTNKAFDYVYDNGGVDSEPKYSYEENDENSCRYDPANSIGSLGEVKTIAKDEKSLQRAVADCGPVAAALDATNLCAYEAGIFSDPECDSSRVNHAVLIVGYGTDGETKKDYWLIKNSWGKGWGENGYFRLLRGYDNHCGIATDASVPLDTD